MKRVMFGSVILSAIGVSLWAYTWWHSPAQTSNVTPVAQTNEAVLGSETKLTSWQTSYFSTSYPSNLRIITINEVAHGMTTGQYLLGSASLSQTDQVAVTVGTLDGLQLSDVSAVKFRQQSNAYELVERSYTPPNGLVFAKTNSYEVAMFWQHDGRYAAVVVSGLESRKASLEDALRSIVTNWQWL